MDQSADSFEGTTPSSVSVQPPKEGTGFFSNLKLFFQGKRKISPLLATLGLVVVLPILVLTVVTTRTSFFNRATSAEPPTVCWNRVGVNTDQSLYWPNACKGDPTAEVCAQSIAALTPEEINGYQKWVSDGKPFISGCGMQDGPTFYQDCGYEGYSVTLGEGNYTAAQLLAKGIKNNDISSIKVPVGYTATLFDGNSFGGVSTKITANNNCLVLSGFNDKTSSVKITKAATPSPTPVPGSSSPTPTPKPSVTPTPNPNPSVKPSTPTPKPTPVPPAADAPVFYKDCNYNGTSVKLGGGLYNSTKLLAAGVRNNDISSVKVSNGYTVTLYDTNSFGGAKVVLTSDTNCLVAKGFNDKTSSIEISYTQAANKPTVAMSCTNSILKAVISWTGGVPDPTFGYIVNLLESPSNGNYYNKTVGNVHTTDSTDFVGTQDSPLVKGKTLVFEPGKTYVANIWNGAHSPDSDPFPVKAYDSYVPGDVNGDGVVNTIDIGIILDSYSSTTPSDPRADINGDGVVNTIDLAIVLDAYKK